MNGGGEEKKEIKMCREEAEVGRQRRIKWRGAYDSLASLQRLPAAIQLLLKATFEKGCQQCQQYRKKGKAAENKEGEQERVKMKCGGNRGGGCCFREKHEQKVNSGCSTAKSSTWKDEHILWTSTK